MTFIAHSGGDVLAPEEASREDGLACVECAESLGIVTSHTRQDGTFVSRHFRHPPAESCGGGESDTHRAMKSIALSKLKETYPEHAAATLEQTIGERQADAYLRFKEPHDTLGYGVVAEAQYRNKEKDIGATTADYLDAGYSVFWLYEDDYDDLDVELGEPVSVWPNAVPESDEWAEIPADARALRTDFKNKYLQETDRGKHWARNMALRGGIEVGFPPAFSKVPPVEKRVSLPLEWYEERATDWFRETDWEELFDEYEWDSRTTLPGPDNGAKRNRHVDAIYHPRWDIDEAAVFRSVPWESLFPGGEGGDDDTPDGAEFKPPSVEREVSFPPEFYEDHRRDLKAAWMCGRGEFELSYRLKPKNAARRCSDCGDDAVAYLFTDGYISKFVCDGCFPNGGIADIPADDTDEVVSA